MEATSTAMKFLGATPPITVHVLGIHDGKLQIRASINRNEMRWRGADKKSLPSFLGAAEGDILGISEDDDDGNDIDNKSAALGILPDANVTSVGAKAFVPKAKTGKEKSINIDLAAASPSKAATKYDRLPDIFPEDKVIDFKAKIYTATGIPVYKQHLFIHDKVAGIIPLLYRLATETPNIVSEIDHPSISVQKIKMVPIRNSSVQDIEIEARDFTTMAEIYRSWRSREFYLISSDEFFGVPGSADRIEYAEIAKDTYQLGLLYGFAVRYFPMMSSDVFALMLRDESQVASSYPDLFPIDNSASILKRKYAFMKSGAKYSAANETLKMFVKTANWRLRTTTTRIQVNIQSLFDSFETSEKIPIISAVIGGFIYTKISNLISNPRIVYGDVKSRLSAGREENDITSSGDMIHFVFLFAKNYIVFQLHSRGNYVIRMSWREEERANFETLSRAVGSIVPFINRINTQNSAALRAGILQVPNAWNGEIAGLEIVMLWRRNVSAKGFAWLIGQARELTTIGIFSHPRGEEAPNDFAFLKGVGSSEALQFIGDMNMYSYLTSASAKQKWYNSVERGRAVTFSHRSDEIRIEARDMKESEFASFRELVLMYLADIREDAFAGASPQSKNALRALQLADPEAFGARGKSGDQYSRVCQKKRQPIPITDYATAVKKMDRNTRERIVKFWNFTTGEEMFYLCPSREYPHLDFVTGIHPKGFCLPCCKKLPKGLPDGSENPSKKIQVRNACMEAHTYTSEDVKSANRYIINYGKEIDSGRIGHLPEIVQKFILYNISSDDILSESTIRRTFTLKGKVYAITKLWRILKNIKAETIKTTDLADVLQQPCWAYRIPGKTEISAYEVMENPRLNLTHYNRIINADLKFPILLYFDREDNKLRIIDGIHRLARAHIIDKKPNISVKYITIKQLRKAEITNEIEKALEPQQSDILADINLRGRTPPAADKFYEVKREEAASATTKDGGGGNEIKSSGFYLYGVPQKHALARSIAVAIAMELPEFVSEMIRLIQLGEKSGIFNKILGGELNMYYATLREFVADLREHFTSTTTQSFTKFLRWEEAIMDIVRFCFGKIVILIGVHEGVTVELPIRGTEIPADIFPDAALEYIIIFKKRARHQITFQFDTYLYYPMFLFIPSNFFRFDTIERRTYTQKDQIIDILRSVVTSHDVVKQNYLSGMTDVDISGLHITSTNVCNGVLVSGNIYLPIEGSDYETYIRAHPEAQVVFGGSILKLCKPADLFSVIRKLPNRELYDGRWMIFGGSIVGIKFRYGISYIVPEPTKNLPALESLLRRAIGVVSARDPASAVKYYLYDPKKIDAVIDRDNTIVGNFTNGIDPAKYNAAVQKKYLYKLFVLGFVKYISGERNTGIRRKFGTCRTISDMLKMIDEHDDISATDSAMLRRIIKNSSTVKQASEEMKTLIFDFDTKVPDKPDAISKFVRSAAKKFVTISNNSKVSAKSPVNVLSSCTVDDPQCSGRLLKVPGKHFGRLVDKLSEELKDPFMRMFVTTAVHIDGQIRPMRFRKRPDEEIFVSLQKK